MINSLTLAVPATSGNIGAGFDCMGVALSLYNTFRFAPATTLQIAITGKGAEKLPRSQHNLVYYAWQRYWQKIGKPVPPVSIEINLAVPTARGLGSSATAICAGVYGANLWAGAPLDRPALVKLASEIEGHPDNVAPALLGGCQLVAGEVICPIPWHGSIGIVVGIPEFELSTSRARQVLPSQVPLQDAVFNCARVGLLTQALATGNPDWLKEALNDRLHQPYRQSLIPAMAEIHQAVLGQGAYGMVISGAGPTLLALGDRSLSQQIGKTMQEIWQNAGIASQFLCLEVAQEGTKYDCD
ncbi:MAG: homoserine kinase [Pseudanabaenaceae cyanobacterium]